MNDDYKNEYTVGDSADKAEESSYKRVDPENYKGTEEVNADPQKSEKRAKLSFGFGLASVIIPFVCCCCFPLPMSFAAMGLAIAAIVLGTMGYFKSPVKDKKALTGFILGIVGAFLGFWLMVYGIYSVISNLSNAYFWETIRQLIEGYY